MRTCFEAVTRQLGYVGSEVKQRLWNHGPQREESIDGSGGLDKNWYWKPESAGQ
jgi:hypothetical protein